MPEHALKTIEQLAYTIPKHGKMVEIGPFCGRSSWCWAKSVDPTVKITCLDIWNPCQHPFFPPADFGKKITFKPDFGAAENKERAKGSLDNFKFYTQDCPNIETIQGTSPVDFKNWDVPLDLVFLDGVHHNPIFHDDLTFWFWKVKPGGVCCGDDFARSHPDVVWTVQDFAKVHGLSFFVEGRIWCIPRPPHRTISDMFARPSTDSNSGDTASMFW
jgi:SAM-dependent methyltransferase